MLGDENSSLEMTQVTLAGSRTRVSLDLETFVFTMRRLSHSLKNASFCLFVLSNASSCGFITQICRRVGRWRAEGFALFLPTLHFVRATSRRARSSQSGGSRRVPRPSQHG